MSQILNGRGVSARFDSDGVHITRSDRQVDIPLSAIQDVRAAQARSVEILLTDGTAHRVEGGNPTATAAFVAALVPLLPAEREPDAGAVVTDTQSSRDWGLYAIMTLGTVLALAYLAYAGWVAFTHGSRVLGVVLGILPLLGGVAMVGSGLAETVRRAVLSRRGITVLAEAVGKDGKDGKDGKETVYGYTDADGGTHRYTCKRTLQRIQLAYDPARRVRAAHADWLPFVVGRVFVKVVGGAFWGVVGAVMVFGVLW
ncbi:hypothetical protein OG866_41095 [Streptomyces sp. NBC_00663]|uniref:hypothetical protein n=1 Tax=Streptomyces sp. NBC_00663 TaxID=2975801 RepID=UPI002E30AFCE|nr:hypothetical protein [Streptomyces sp. NBC_00663]